MSSHLCLHSAGPGNLNSATAVDNGASTGSESGFGSEESEAAENGEDGLLEGSDSQSASSAEETDEEQGSLMSDVEEFGEETDFGGDADFGGDGGALGSTMGGLARQQEEYRGLEAAEVRLACKH